jgi:hypothetical protein
MRQLLVAVTTFAAILVSTAQADTLSFTFSFINQSPPGTVNGTVTGRIDGLADSGTSAAKAVFVTSSPAGPSTHFLHQTTFLLSKTSLLIPIPLQ